MFFLKPHKNIYEPIFSYDLFPETTPCTRGRYAGTQISKYLVLEIVMFFVRFEEKHSAKDPQILGNFSALDIVFRRMLRVKTAQSPDFRALQ